MNNLQYVKV